MIEIWQADAQGRYAHPRDNRALPNTKFNGFGRSATDKDGVLQLRHREAWSRAGAERQATGAAYRVLHLLARHAAANLHAALFLGRGRERRRSHSGAGAGGPPRHAHCPQRGAAGLRRSIASISVCRAKTRRFSSIFERPDLAEIVRRIGALAAHSLPTYFGSNCGILPTQLELRIFALSTAYWSFYLVGFIYYFACPPTLPIFPQLVDERGRIGSLSIRNGRSRAGRETP